MLKASRDAEADTGPFKKDLITLWKNGRKEILTWKQMEVEKFYLYFTQLIYQYKKPWSNLRLNPCRDLSCDKIVSWLVQAASKGFVDIPSFKRTECRLKMVQEQLYFVVFVRVSSSVLKNRGKKKKNNSGSYIVYLPVFCECKADISSQSVTFLHVTIQGFMLFSSCRCTIFQSRLLCFKLECVHVSPRELVKCRFCFRRPGMAPKILHSNKC